jgi:streptogramin lyase
MPLARIDPRTNHIVQQFSGDGGGAVLVAQGAIWITATPTTVWRLDPKLIEATRQ